MDLQQQTKALQNKFDKVSTPYKELLKNGTPGSERFYANILLSLASGTMSNYNMVIQAYNDEQVYQIAWATRSLLELAVWSEYCAKSFSNAEQFFNDALRDAIGLFQAMENLSSLAKNLKGNDDIAKAKQKLSDTATKMGISNLDRRYKTVDAVAKELGESQAATYKNFNVLLSKFVHPTAFVINIALDRSWTKLLIDNFFAMAVTCANGSLNEIAKADLRAV